MNNLTSFPFLSHAEFETACQALVDRVLSNHQVPWADIRLEKSQHLGNVYVRIVKVFDRKCSAAGAQSTRSLSPEEDVEHDDDDPDMLDKSSIQCDLEITYSLVLSPTYRVPTLYFHIRDKPMTLETIQSALVPLHLQDAVKQTGVVGAISWTNNPVDDLPCFFVHPCRTADALRAASDATTITPFEYLQLWFGIIGNAVGLSLPLDIIANEKAT